MSIARIRGKPGAGPGVPTEALLLRLPARPTAARAPAGRPMMPAREGNSSVVHVVDALATGHEADVAQLIFEYLAITQVEAGRARPASVHELPPVLRDECQNIAESYGPPGVPLMACQEEEPIGCVGLMRHKRRDIAVVKRLYVRPPHRGRGVARAPMGHAHRHAEQQGFARLALDVLASRADVIGFYRRLGYTEDPDAPGTTGGKGSMRYLHRPIYLGPDAPEPAGGVGESGPGTAGSGPWLR